MVKYEKKLYKFIRFEKGSYPKKYNAILQNRETKREVKVPFGDRNLPQYKDSTGLGLYTKKNTLDKNKRRQFRARFSGLKQKQNWNKEFTSLYFSWRFLWI